VSLEIGLSPKLVVTLNKVFDVDPDAFAAVLAANKERKTFYTILSALQTANQWQGKIQFRNRHFRKIEIELAIPPAVRMYFQEDRREEAPPSDSATFAPPLHLEPEGSTSEPVAEPDLEAPLSEEAPAESPPEPDDVPELVEEPPPPIEPVPEPPEWLRMWCQGCERAYRVTAVMAGKKAKCRKCRTWIIVENVPEE
jgi:hypothetical protein